MDFKEFFRLTKKKLILAAIIFSLLPVIPILIEATDVSPWTEYQSLLRFILMPLGSIQFSIITILGLIGAYIISSIFIHLWNRINPGTKLAFKENLKVSKGKLIISTLGWITAILLFLGSYLGNPLAGYFNSIMLILLPFTLLTIHVFLNIAGALLSFLLVEVPTKLPVIDYTQLTYYNPVTMILVLIFLIIEWYLFSCLILYIFNKIRKR